MRDDCLRNLVLACVLGLAGSAFAQAQADAPAPSDPFTALIQQRLLNEDTPVCVAVGTVSEIGRAAFACNKGAGPLALDSNSVFEIGSVSKVFTGLLLADMVRRGEVTLADPISKYAPAGAKLPTFGGKEITLGDLVTHRSALPRLPPGFVPADMSNPYAAFDSTALYRALAATTLDREIGTRQEYSNFGFMLLSDLLGRRAGKRYDELLAERVLKPLTMGATSASPGKAVVQGHGAGYQPVPPWDFDPALGGVGAVRSSLIDMLRFVEAASGRRPQGLGLSFSTSLLPLVNEPQGTSTLFAWGMRKRTVGRLVFHNGQTGGMRATIVVNPDNGTGAVVLTDSPANLDDLAFHLVDPTLPLRAKRAEIVLDEAKLEEYVGTYQLAPEFALRVFREGERLLVQATGQDAVPMFAEAPDRFFLKLVDAQLTFRRDAGGKVDMVVLRQGGRDVPGPRRK
jgi:D-alanyl-D-alanine-carboxypeptidase/D-alanyl-D-alanine-endopeptidase